MFCILVVIFIIWFCFSFKDLFDIFIRYIIGFDFFECRFFGEMNFIYEFNGLYMEFILLRSLYLKGLKFIVCFVNVLDKFLKLK